MEELINEDTKCPDICLRAIDIVNEALGRHVDGGTNVDVFELSPG